MVARSLLFALLLSAFVAGAAPAATGPTGSAAAQLASFACENGMAGPDPCKKVDLKRFVSLPQLGGATGNDVWGWTDPQTGREYALVGTSTSTGFVDVTDPRKPVVVGSFPRAGRPTSSSGATSRSTAITPSSSPRSRTPASRSST